MSALVALGVLLTTWTYLPARMDGETETVNTRLSNIGLLGVPFPVKDAPPPLRPAAADVSHGSSLPNAGK
jgi:hypothetical protein